MALRPAFDLELLRTLVFIGEEASFTKAAVRVGRTQSAVTLQVQKLEALVGQPLVVRSKGGPVELTPQGRVLVESARAMLKLNDEAFRALASHDLPTTVRLATSSTFVSFLPRRLFGRVSLSTSKRPCRSDGRMVLPARGSSSGGCPRPRALPGQSPAAELESDRSLARSTKMDHVDRSLGPQPRSSPAVSLSGQLSLAAAMVG
jgi:molybdenum-dependent DNA-binding transcriptional regulator ModE